MFQTVVTGLLLGFITSSSCPSNAILIRTPAHTPLSRLAYVGLGAVTGYAVLLLVSLAWIVPLVRAVPQTIPFLELFGALVFLYLSWTLLRDKSSTRQDPAGATRSEAGRAPHFVGGLGATALNPINLAWWSAFLSPALRQPGGIPPFYPVAILAGSLGWFLFFAALLRFSRNRWKERAHATFRWGGAAVLAAFGIRFLIGAIIDLAGLL